MDKQRTDAPAPAPDVKPDGDGPHTTRTPEVQPSEVSPGGDPRDS